MLTLGGSVGYVVGMENPPRTVTTGEAAKLFNVTPSTIKRWADAGSLPHTRTIGGHLRFNRAELEVIKAANTHPATEVAS